MSIFRDDDDFLSSTPASNYFSIAKTANENIVELEIGKMFRRLALAEKMLEERDLEDEYEKQLKALIVSEDLDNRTNSIYIELVGNIVTQCE